jgi:peptidoglycan/xylan/chitin deacetylase (PgdA/CDA1 family)
MERPSTPLPEILASLLAGLVLTTPALADPGMDFPPAMYAQEIKLVFSSPDAAARARIQVEPLHDGHHRAVSCRWDDNATGNVETRRLMEKHGIRGTWYLNDRNHGSGYAAPGEEYDYLETARGLLQGGNSIGAHSLSHPFITYLHRNRMFEETAGCRVEWEANLDTPVVSYAYSFIDIRAEPEGKGIQLDTMRTLERAGLYHVAEYLNFFDDLPNAMEFSPIMPTEHNPIGKFTEAVKWAYDEPKLDAAGPMISNSMHAWYGSQRIEFGYDELERRLDLMAGLDDVWHCNQNAYAAYRRQFRTTRLTPGEPAGDTVSVRIERPRVVDLNDSVDLTLAVLGVASDELLRVDCPTAVVVASSRPREGKLVFHLPHDRNQQLPEKIGSVASPKNDPDLAAADPDFPEIVGALHVKGDSLTLKLANDGNKALEKVRLTWRLPLGWKDGVRVITPDAIAAGTRQSYALTATPAGSDKFRIGSAYFVAQLDFVKNGKAGRIHFTCNGPRMDPDASWPREGFSLLGPIPKESFDADQIAGLLANGPCTETIGLTGQAPLKWRKNARDGFVRQDWLDPEYIRTMGTWDAASPGYVLRSKVASPVARSVEFICSREQIGPLFLNGKRVVDFKGELLAGENELVMIYPPDVLRVGGVRLAACFLRLVDPATGNRLHDVQYHAW